MVMVTVGSGEGGGGRGGDGRLWLGRLGGGGYDHRLLDDLGHHLDDLFFDDLGDLDLARSAACQGAHGCARDEGCPRRQELPARDLGTVQPRGRTLSRMVSHTAVLCSMWPLYHGSGAQPAS